MTHPAFYLNFHLTSPMHLIAPPHHYFLWKGQERSWSGARSRLVGKVAHTQLRANKRVWIEVEGVTTLNKCALEEGAAARERALRKIVAKLSYGINLQFYEPFIWRSNNRDLLGSFSGNLPLFTNTFGSLIFEKGNVD